MLLLSSGWRFEWAAELDDEEDWLLLVVCVFLLLPLLQPCEGSLLSHLSNVAVSEDQGGT